MLLVEIAFGAVLCDPLEESLLVEVRVVELEVRDESSLYLVLAEAIAQYESDCFVVATLEVAHLGMTSSK